VLGEALAIGEVRAVNTKYRKKPIVIEAWQWMPDENQEQMPPAPSHLLKSRLSFWGIHKGWKLKTLEGWYMLTPGDYLICGVKGEWYPCKPDIFDLTYEPVILEDQ